jgi:hypothetical protein
MTNAATTNPQARVRGSAHRCLRRVVVAENLAALHGPDSGVVELPQRLCRSGGQRVFDMSDTDQVLDMYESVLEDARTQADLAGYANGELLVRLWPQPFLPRRIRQAWEDVHPLLAVGGMVPDDPSAVTGGAGVVPAEPPSAAAAAVALWRSRRCTGTSPLSPCAPWGASTRSPSRAAMPSWSTT